MNDPRLLDRQNIDESVFHDCSMARARFDDVRLSEALFSNVNLQGAQFRNVNLKGVVIDDANIAGLMILGYDIQTLINAKRRAAVQPDPAPAAEAAQLANPIRRSLADAARRMRGLRADHGISASKLSVLGRLLRAEGPLTATALAALERLQPQSLTRIIGDLEGQGLIARRQNAEDRRQLDIGITQTGADLLRQDAQLQNRWLAEAMQTRLTPAERAILALAAELLDRLANQPQTKPDVAPPGPRPGA